MGHWHEGSHDISASTASPPFENMCPVVMAYRQTQVAHRYVAMYACMYLLIYVCMHACMYVCMHACMYVYARICVCFYAHI